MRPVTPSGDHRRRIGWVAIAGLGLLVAIAAPIRPAVGLLRLRWALPAAAAAAGGLAPRMNLDIARVLAGLDVDPSVRASGALYQASLLMAREGGGRPNLPLPPVDDLASAVRTLDILLADRLRRAPPDGGGLVAAASATGVDLGYLRRTAARESGFNAFARARTSSARGMFQFIEQTWLRAIARWGGQHGRGREAALVRFDREGRAYVTDPADARAILALRYDPDLSALMAAELARENQILLGAALGRPLRGGELYAAHLFGAEGALRLIRAAEVEPGRAASTLMPQAAAANRNLFAQGPGWRSAGDLLGSLR